MANKLSVELSLNAKGYQSEIDKSKEATNDFNKSVDDASKSTAQYTNTIGKQTKDLTSLRKQLAQSKKEAQNLAMAYNQLSDAEKNSGVGRQMKKQLDEAIQSAGNFQDVLGDVQRQIKNVASDTATWDTLSEGITVAGSALSTLGGAYASLTGDQESFNKAIALYTTTQSAATTITKVANLLQKESNLMMKIAEIQEWAKTKAVIAGTAATKGATIAQRAFNLVAKANPYVLLATACAAAGAALAAYTLGTKDSKKEQERLNQELERSKKELKDLNDKEDYKIRVAEAAGAGADELRRMRFEAAKAANELAYLNMLKITGDKNATQEQKQSAIDQEQQTWEHWIKVQQDNEIERIKEKTNANKNNNDTRNEELTILQKLNKDEQQYISLLQDAVAKNDELAKTEYAEKLKNVRSQIQNINDEVKKLTEAVEDLTPLERLQNKQKELNDLLDHAVQTNNQLEVVKYSSQLQQVNQELDDMNDKLEKARSLTVSRPTETPKFATGPNLPKTIDMGTVPVKINPLWKMEKNIGDIIEDTDPIFGGVEAIDSLQNSMSSLVQSIQEGANAWDIFTGAIAVVQSAMQTFQSVMEGIAAVQEIINTLTVKGTEKKKEEAVQTVSTAGAEISAESGKAVATATAEGTKAGWPALLWAIPAAIAAVVGALALIGSFEKGGVVPGSSFHGDNLVARVNSGEMILNQRQQKNMFDAIDRGSLGGGHVNVDGNITIKGSDLHVALRNYDKKISKIS